MKNKVSSKEFLAQQVYSRLKQRHELRVAKRKANIKSGMLNPTKERPGVHEDLTLALNLIYSLLNPSPENKGGV